MSDGIPTKEIGELLDEVSNKVPKLIHGLLESLYSAEAGKRMGQAVGNLYKELIEAGIPQEEALKMAKDFMLSLKDISGNFTGSGNSK
jgi:hypothetical protein